MTCTLSSIRAKEGREWTRSEEENMHEASSRGEQV
jgi:hypothetical protein